jgi:CRISPR/Cas system CMR subunit Cmr6 (Cas7 group RAMP superfamily)
MNPAPSYGYETPLEDYSMPYIPAAELQGILKGAG